MVLLGELPSGLDPGEGLYSFKVVKWTQSHAMKLAALLEQKHLLLFNSITAGNVLGPQCLDQLLGRVPVW